MSVFKVSLVSIFLWFVPLQEGLMSVGVISDPTLCENIHKSHLQNPVVFWKVDDTDSLEEKPQSTSEVHVIQGADSKEILEAVLNLLPNPKLLNETDFQVKMFQFGLATNIYCNDIFRKLEIIYVWGWKIHG